MINLQITHSPLGLEHPYQQEPFERFPRQPISGLPTRLGAAIQSDTVPDRVQVEWYWKDQSIQTISARPVDTNLWQAELPAGVTGQEMHYRFSASVSAQTTFSDWFGYTVHGFHPVGTPRSYQLRSEGFSIQFSATPWTPASQLHITWNDSNHLQCSFDVHASESGWRPVEDKQDIQVEIGQEKYALSVSFQPFSITLKRGDQSTILSMLTLPVLETDGKGTCSQIHLSFASSADEGFYGFGERYNALNQRGNRLDILVYEQYKNQELRTYMPIPFFLSSNGYAFRINDPVVAHFDLCQKQAGQWTVEAEFNRDDKFCFDIWTHPTPARNLQAYLNSTSPAKLPPDWVFGPWMSSNEWNSQAEVMKQADLTRDLDIPATVLVIEAWSDEATFYIWNGAKYEPKPGDQVFKYSDFSFDSHGLWPNPKAMVEELHRRGIKLILWQIPTLKKMDEPHTQNSLDEAAMLEKGYHLKYADGTPYKVRPFWFHDSLLLDPSNPQGVDWWLNKRAYLLDELQVDGFKTDGGEHLWGEDVVFHNGMRGHEGMNAYPDLYIGAYHRFTNQHRGNNGVTFSRAGFSSAQAFPCHWAGDENSTWTAYQSAIRAGLNAGLAGIFFWGWDIAGFSKEIPSAELYLRSTAMAAFCPVMQYHSEFHNHDIPSHDRTPWNIAACTGHPEVVDIYRKFAKLRMRLMPYITAEARWSAEHATPLMRPLFMDWPEDPVVWNLDDQYLFGRDLLVAPVTVENASTRRLYLPAGQWKCIWKGEVRDGNCWITVPAPLDQIPVFQRLEPQNKDLAALLA
jgi:alpha-glucosidase (family GH31 glycosyl hydrolase)